MTVEVYALLVDKQLKRWPERKQREVCWMSADDAAKSVKEPGLTQLMLRLKDILELGDVLARIFPMAIVSTDPSDHLCEPDAARAARLATHV